MQNHMTKKVFQNSNILHFLGIKSEIINKGSPRAHKLTTPQSDKFSKWEKKSPLCRGSLKTTKQARLQSQQSLTIGTTGDKCLKPQTCDFQKKNNIATDAEFVTNGTRVKCFWLG